MKKFLSWLFVMLVSISSSVVSVAVEPSSPLPADVKATLQEQIRQERDYQSSRLNTYFLCDIRQDPDLAEYLEATGGRDIHVDLGDIYVAFVLRDFEVFMCLADDTCGTHLACGTQPHQYDRMLGEECYNKLMTSLSNHSQQEFINALRKALRESS